MLRNAKKNEDKESLMAGRCADLLHIRSTRTAHLLHVPTRSYSIEHFSFPRLSCNQHVVQLPVPWHLVSTPPCIVPKPAGAEQPKPGRGLHPTSSNTALFRSPERPVGAAMPRKLGR